MSFWLFSALGVTVAFLQSVFYPPKYIVCSPSANIYTVDEANPRVQCISVAGSRIVNTGDYFAIRDTEYHTFGFLEPFLPTSVYDILSPQVITLPPQSILVPGLADAHAHVIENGFKMQLQLETARSVADVINLLVSYLHAHPEIKIDPTRWIEGLGWDQTKWPGAQFPTQADFEEEPVLAGRLIALRRVDVHALWVSKRVLELAGELPSNIEGGVIVRDEKGNPTGVLVDNAMSLVPLPKWSEEQVSMYFETTIQAALEFGITSIHDAASEPAIISFMKKQADKGSLPIRLYLMGNIASDDYWGGEIPRLINYGRHGRLNVRSVKLFTDGALGSWGAALLEPYSDRPDTTGLMRSSKEVLAKLIQQFWKDNWQVNIHCIGDRANNVALDIFEDIIVGQNLTEVDVALWRPRIEHSQIMTPDDILRIGRLGVIASVQPTHADMWYAETRLGPDRMKGAYAYQSLLQVSPNKVLPLGSDFPVEGVNPLVGFYAAVSRLSVDGTSPHGPEGWFVNERLTRAQALKGMTLDPAYASFADHDLGSLTPGKKADFVVLDRDIMTLPVQEILQTKVCATVIDGRVAYGTLRQ
ncbi:amidohydrolase family-domain-containing protein [Mucidula mucida]|nr:amidohydrolase family-domain-containing protein [Mucidula mucida]